MVGEFVGVYGGSKGYKDSSTVEEQVWNVPFFVDGLQMQEEM